MKTLKYLSYTLLFFVSACGIFFEIDISGDSVNLLTPPDSTRSTTVSQDFRWEEIDGAKEYEVQIVSPSFESPQNFFLDTTVVDARVSFTLEPGTFQWRVRPINNGYDGIYATRTLFIDSTESLSGQNVELLTPANASVVSSDDIVFRWNEVLNAERYLLEVLGSNGFDTLVFSNVVTKSLSAEQSYQWRVTALNDFSANTSNTFTFTLDKTAPTVPTLLSPADGTNFNNLPITFSWQRTSTDVAYDNFYLYNESLVLLGGYPIQFTGTSYTIPASSSLPNGTYFSYRCWSFSEATPTTQCQI